MTDLVKRLRDYTNNTDDCPLRVEAADEIERLNNALRWEQNRAERIGTHGPDCHTWGHQHYECLLRKYERLTAERNAFQDQCIALKIKMELMRGELAECRKDAERYRFLRCQDNDDLRFAVLDEAYWRGAGDCDPCFFDKPSDLDDAIDAAMQEAKP